MQREVSERKRLKYGMAPVEDHYLAMECKVVFVLIFSIMKRKLSNGIKVLKRILKTRYIIHEKVKVMGYKKY